MTTPLLELTSVSKHFCLHHQEGAVLKALDEVNIILQAGECLVLDGPSGMGKSTLLKLIYANYRVSAGSIRLCPPGENPVELTQASPNELIRLRQSCMSYVSQFLRVIPRVAAEDVVAEPLLEGRGMDQAAIEDAREKSQSLLNRLRIPQKLWRLPPATFSGGEQQRINIARSLIKPRPLLLLDEPTASLDEANSRTVIELMNEAREKGAGLIGIFHDSKIGAALASRRIDVSLFRKA
jgi:alpha-D-ribose 1-methylphosphonate 5-triphosphate synthase subunit PhnL